MWITDSFSCSISIIDPFTPFKGLLMLVSFKSDIALAVICHMWGEVLKLSQYHEPGSGLHYQTGIMNLILFSDNHVLLKFRKYPGLAVI